MKTRATNFLLLGAAVGLALVLFPLGLLFTFWRCAVRWSGRKTVGYLANTAFVISLSLDLMGNVVCRDLFNALLIRDDLFGFGWPYETVSSVLGRHKAQNNLTDAGRALANLLNWLDPGHVERAAEKHQRYANPTQNT